MFKKNKGKELQKPTVFSTSSITRTENTITTANGVIRTSRIVKTSYQQSITSSSGTSNVPQLMTENSRYKLRSAFDEPVHSYTKKLPDKLAITSGGFSRPNEINGPKKFEKFFEEPTPFKPPQFGLPNNQNIFNNELNNLLNVKVICTGKFHDDNSKIPTYQTRSPKRRGRLLLINNIEFKGKRRDGADIDQRNIVLLFKQIGFEVIEHKNKRKNEMERIVKNFATSKDLEKCDICVTVIMSHGTTYGEQTMIESIDGLVLSTEWVVQQFDGINCKSMSGKPKIFIFQCCRGDNENKIVQTDASVFQKPEQLRQVQDILISYSTIPGFVAYRDPKLGSWYIQGLCKVFMEHSHDTHIEDLLKIVDFELAKLNEGSQRQTSSYENRGFKRCYLHPIGK